MVIATRMPMPAVMGMPVTMCTGTSTIGKHAARMGGICAVLYWMKIYV